MRRAAAPDLWPRWGPVDTMPPRRVPALSPPTDDASELREVRLRLLWGAAALTGAALLMLIGEPVVQAHRLLVGANVVLGVASAATAIAAGRRPWSARTMYALGTGLAFLTLAITLVALGYHPDLRFVIMIVVQMIGAGVLFFSTAWLMGYLTVTVVASTWLGLELGRIQEVTLIAASAVLAGTIHLALRDHERRNNRAHAEALAAALELARRELRDKERAEGERAEAQRDSESYQAQLLQAQKMEAIGTLAGGVAHDMNNALAAIIGFAECIHGETDSATIRDDAEQIRLAANRAAELTRNLLGFGRRGQFLRAASRPESLITGLVTLLARTLPKGIKIETVFADRLAGFDVDSSALTHALVNLCINASDAMAGHGVLTLGVVVDDVAAEPARALGVEPGPHVVLSVRDTGHGMDAAVQARIFEPFFTTKPQGQGTGLGLAMVYGTIKRHGGAITVDSTPGQGTTFKLYVRASTGAPISDRELTPVAVPVPAGGRILVVDDDDLVRTVLVRTLERAGYTVAVAVNGKAGLDALAASDALPDLVLLDMAMPVMAGPETFRRARRRHPDLKVLLISGFTSSSDARALLAEGALGLIEKPFTPARLLASIDRALAGRHSEPIAVGWDA